MSLRKRILSWFIITVMIFGVLPYDAIAAEETLPNEITANQQVPKESESDNLEFESNDIVENGINNATPIAGHESYGDEVGRASSYSLDSYTLNTVSQNTGNVLGDNAGNVTRDIVLVLDNSISMEGTPLANLKESAIKFCTSVLSADGTNRVAIVAYDTDIAITTSFTNSLDTLSSSINAMDGEGSWTNITIGVQKADELFKTSSSASIKNIVVMTDGVPTAGPYNSIGQYTYEDYSGTHNADHFVFEYANVLYDTMTSLFEKYNIYTLGFFHNTSENAKAFASKILTDTQNVGYYEVNNPDDLEFTFGEVAEDMTQTQMRNLYSKQHISYYNGNYKREIQQISPPDTDGNTRENTNYLLGNLVLDAAEDNVSTSYNVASIITDSLNLNFDFISGSVSNYEFILADIVTSSYYKDVLKEAYTAAAIDDTKILLQGIVDYGFQAIDEMAKKANVSADTLRQEWQTLAQTLDQIKVCDNPNEYATLFGKCSVIIDKYMKSDDQKKFWESLNGKKGYKGKALSATIGALVGATIDTATEAMTYYACYDAYCTASDTYKEVLTLIAYYADSVIQTGAGGNQIYIGGIDKIFYCTSLSTAIDHFLENANEEATGAQQIAKRFAREGIKNFGEAFAEAGVDVLLDCIPIVKELNKIRKVAGLTATGVMVTVNSLTEIDDRAYAASMLYHLYFLTNCVAEASDLCGEFLLNAPDNEKEFEWAYRFDEAVRVWRCCSIMLCDFGVEFESYCLQAAQKKLKPWTNDALKKANWYSTAISMAALEKSLISSIHCHDANLSYDPNSKIVDLRGSAQIITIACPVTVYVNDESGKQIALLSDNSQTIEPGYEPYFHVLETGQGNQDYMKICYIPDSWNITFSGTASGTMHVFKANINDGKIQSSLISPEIFISEGTQGHISNSDAENIAIIDNVTISDKVTINFDANGGSVGTTKQEVIYNETYGTLPVAERTGYIFQGWYTDNISGNKMTPQSIVSTTGHIILSAHWKAKTYKVIFRANGGKTNITSKKVIYTKTYGSLPKPTRKGHTFKGWYTKKKGGTKITKRSKVKITRNTTLYAHWKAKKYKVIFKANRGKINATSKKVIYTKTYGLLPKPTRKGYTFKGWYTKKKGGTKITKRSKVKTARNMTLYAHWKRK